MPRPLSISLLLAGAIASSAAAFGADRPYDESADAKAELHAALREGASTGRPVLILFGANWCEDCRALDHALKKGRNAELIAHDFRVVKVDVGNFDRNGDLVKAYGDPTAHGIPSAVIVAPDNRVLFATRAGELADARRMSEDGLHEFFAKAAGAAGAGPR